MIQAIFPSRKCSNPSWPYYNSPSWIREDRWHKSQTFTDLPDGSLQVDMLVTGSVDVKRWILSFGKDAEVLAPKHLRSEIAAEAAEMGRSYS